MIEKLRSHLRKTRGFTLIELLIVIAIIAVLVVVAIVAINPIERIRDANDEGANSDVRTSISAVMACATKELALDAAADVPALCGTWALLQAGNYVSGAEPAGLVWATGAGDQVCVFSACGHTPTTFAGGDSTRSNIEECTDAGGVANACPVP